MKALRFCFQNVGTSFPWNFMKSTHVHSYVFASKTEVQNKSCLQKFPYGFR